MAGEAARDDARGRSGGPIAAWPEQVLEPIPPELTATSYRPPDDLAYGRWLAIGEALQEIERAVQW